jgi:hypothetical protein
MGLIESSMECRMGRAGRAVPPVPAAEEGSHATVRALFVVMLQVFVQGRHARFFQQVLEHHVLAAALCEVRAIFLSQGGNLGVPVLTFNSPALVAMTMVET